MGRHKRPAAVKAARARAERLRKTLKVVDYDGRKSANAIASKLNEMGIPTIRNGKGWTAKGVLRLQSRLRLTPAVSKARKEREQLAQRRVQTWRSFITRQLKFPLKTAVRNEFQELLPLVGDKPFHWPARAVRYSKWLKAYVLDDGSALTLSGEQVPSTPKVMERRRRYTRHMTELGRPEVYHPFDDPLGRDDYR